MLTRNSGSGSGGASSLINDAANDGKHYGRKSATWVETNAADTTFTPVGTIAAATVQAAVAEVATDAATALTGHTGLATGAHAASAIANTAAGGIAATTVQGAINELDTEKANLASPTFTGTPAAPTAAALTATTQLATTAFVGTATLAATLMPYIKIEGQLAAGTSGGGCTLSTWNVRALSTEVVDTGNHASIASNQITLSAGTYRVRASAPAFKAESHRIRLRNVTDGTTVAVGGGAYCSSVDNTTTHSHLSGRFTIAASKALELQHHTGATQAGNGLGVGSSSGEVEVYAEIEFWKEN